MMMMVRFRLSPESKKGSDRSDKGNENGGFLQIAKVRWRSDYPTSIACSLCWVTPAGGSEKMGPHNFPERPQVQLTKPPDYLNGNRDDSARAKEQQRGCTGRHRLVTSIDRTRNS
jgi:hypothetical protein